MAGALIGTDDLVDDRAVACNLVDLEVGGGVQDIEHEGELHCICRAETRRVTVRRVVRRHADRK